MRTIVQLPNATWKDSIRQLKKWKIESGSPMNVDTVKEIYESLWAEFSLDKLGTWLRYSASCFVETYLTSAQG